jgi:PPM family protein phosphatase
MSTRATKTAPVLDWSSATDKGPRRDNQDRVLLADTDNPQLDQRGTLLVLCDGVGGEEGGHVAAEIASAEVHRVYYGEALADTQMLLKLALDRAWLAVKTESLKSAQHARMATTCVAAVVHQGVLHVAWVGDSRAYLLRGGRLKQITDDHSYVNQQIKMGVITPEEAKRSQYRGVLTRSLAAMADHTSDAVSEPLQTGDRVLLCSDGLHSVIEDRGIEQALASAREAGAGARDLVALALKHKTGDNVTVAVLNYGVGVAAAPAHATATMRTAAQASAAAVPQPLDQRPSRAPWAIAGVLVALLVGGGAAAWAAGLLPGAGGAVEPVAATQIPAVAPTDNAVVPAVIEATSVLKQPTALPGAPTQKDAPTATTAPNAEPTSTQAVVPPTPTRRPTSTPRPPTRTPVPEPTATRQTPVVTTLAIPTAPPLQSQPQQPSQPQPEPPKQEPPQPPTAPPSNDPPPLPGAELVTTPP